MVFTLAVGIGANTALFAYLSFFLWPTLDTAQPARVAQLWDGDLVNPVWSISYRDFDDYRRSCRSFSHLSAERVFATSVDGGERSTFTWGWLVSGDFFSLLGKQPLLGRALGPQDDRPEAPRVAVVSYNFYRDRLGGSPEALGRALTLDGRATFTVVGVMPPGFSAMGLPQALYIPLAHWREVGPNLNLDDRNSGLLQSFARLAPGVSLAQARAEVAAVAAGLDREAPLAEPRRLNLQPATDAIPDPATTHAQVLMAAVACFLFLAAANVANLLLVRALARRKEMAVQVALGAGRSALVRRLLAETTLLSVVASAAGAWLGYLAIVALEPTLRSVPLGFGNWAEDLKALAFDGRTLLFAVAVGCGATLLCGLAPLFELRRRDLVAPLKSDATSGRKGRLRQTLVVAQVALSVLLLLAAALLVRSLGRIYDVEPGFARDRLQVASFYLPETRPAAATLASLRDRLTALPGVAAMGLVYRPPLFGGYILEAFQLPEREEPVRIGTNAADAGYFAALGLQLVAGRGIEAQDGPGAAGVVVVTEALAKELWPNGSALGRQLSPVRSRRPGEPASYEVVGVVADHRVSSLKDPPTALAYFSLAQRPRNRFAAVLRSALPAARLAPQLEAALRAEDPALALIELQPFSQQLDRALFEEHLSTRVAAAVGLLGLLLATIGTFSVISYSARQRQREIGIRMALGASRRAGAGVILAEASWLVGGGLALGMLAAIALGRLLRSMLYGVGEHDPLAYLLVTVAMASAALLAAYPPARRAAAVEPASVLRAD